MSVASELQRIKNAKDIIGRKAVEMGLEYTDETTQRFVKLSLDNEGNPNETIDKVAEGIDSIVSLFPHEAVLVFEPEIDENGLITANAHVNYGVVVKDAGSDPDKQVMAKTKQLDVQGANTITPTKQEQVAVEQWHYTTGQVKVAPIPDNYVDVTDITKGEGDVIVDYETVQIPAGYYPNAVNKEVAYQDEVVVDFDVMTGDTFNADINKFVCSIRVDLNESLENTLASI